MMRIRISAILLALALTACEPQQPQAVPPPPASPETPAPGAPADTPPADTSPAPAAPSGPATSPAAPSDPTTSPAAPAQPAPDAPPPTDPAPAPQPTASASPVPAVESMAAARPSAKMSVAADLRYQFESAVVDGQPVALNLAAIPRVAGTNLNVQVKPVPGLEISQGSLSAQKVAAAGVYRQQLSVTRRAGAPRNLRVLVTMDMPEGKAFGFFTIPLDGVPASDGNTAQKSDSVKQR